jgi:UDP-glucose 4-epimerase
MKILVTGGAGFIGSNVVDAYIENGHKVIVVDDLSTGRLSNLNPKAKFYQLDIRDPQLRDVFIEERPQLINHHAAQIDVRRSVADPEFDAEVNVLGSIKLARLAVEFGVSKIIYISSGGAIYGEPVYLPCDEDHPIRPICPYGASKYTFEIYLQMFNETDSLDYTILRYGNVYGPRQDPLGEAGVVAIFCGQMLKGSPVTINGTGKQVRDFVYVGDCARANLITLQKGSSRAYNLGVGIGIDINQIFSEVKSITGYEPEAIYGPEKAGETSRIYLTAERAKEELGWEPEVSLTEGLEQTVAYFRRSET